MKTQGIFAILLIFAILFCGCAPREVTTLELPNASETTATLPAALPAPEAPEVETAPESTEPVVLTLAIAADCPVLFPFGQMFRDFNDSQSRYRIDYTIYSGNGLTDTQPMELLRTQILAGDAPDLYAFYTDGYMPTPLTPERVGVDLLPLLGETVTADTLVPGLFDLMTAGGALYELPLTVAVDTVIAPARLLPEPGVTLDELEQARSQMPSDWTPVGSWNTPDNLFAGFCTAYCIGAYTDRASGACDFAQQSFYDFLTWCKTWGGDGSIPPAPKQELLRIWQIESLAWLDRRSEIVQEHWFGEPEYTYVGFPTADGSVGNGYRVRTSLAVSPQCKDVEAAKAVLEYCFSYVQAETIPANYALLRAELGEYIAGNRTDWRGEVQQVSEADAAQFDALLHSVSILEGMDAPLAQILQEEASACFAGTIGAEQAAENIQNRASLYLKEQRTE